MGTITGAAGNDNLSGTQYDDQIYGLGGNDTIRALDGNDTVFGDETTPGAPFGADSIDGGGGDDTLDGGAGNDALLGGAGNDTFVFDTADLTGRGTRLGGESGFDVLAASGAVSLNTTGSSVSRIEAFVTSAADTEGQRLTVSLNEIALESTNAAGRDANLFVALFGGGNDTLVFANEGWTRTATLNDVDPFTPLPASAIRLGSAEVSLLNAAWAGGALDPATGLGSAIALDCLVFTKGSQIVTVWTDAETVI